MQVTKRNYQKEMEQLIEKFQREEKVPRLLLHSCCAPCSSYVLEYLSDFFEICVFYYNPNIYPEEEYQKRVEEQRNLIQNMKTKYPVTFLEGDFDPKKFYEAVRGMEQIPEGGERCFKCYALRLEEAAKAAVKTGADYFTTTLSISPLKKADKLNEIGEKLGEQYHVPYLMSDFKKRNGYKRSTELSRQYGLYRQDYCGCIFSRNEREAWKNREETLVKKEQE